MQMSHGGTDRRVSQEALRDTQAHRFEIKLFEFSCEDLPKFETSEFYLNIDFAGFKVFKTAIENDNTAPEWNFKASFLYTLHYLEKLRSLKLKIKCLNRRTDNMVGEAEIDLHTIACGPSKFKLSLKAPGSGERKGALNFICLMKMVSQDLTIILQNMKLTMMGVSSAARIDVTSSLDENKSILMPHNVEGKWKGPFKLEVETSLCDLLKAPSPEHVHFDVIDSEGMKQGAAGLPLRLVANALGKVTDESSSFNVEIMYSLHSAPDEEPAGNIGRIGELEGEISFQNLPRYAQMVGGLCEDGQIIDAQILAKNLPYPRSMGKEPPVWQDPADVDRTDIDNILEALGQDLQQQNDDNEEHQDAEVDDEALTNALEKIDVPPPWEKRRERVNDRPSNRMYFVDPRSRKTTYKDPRFVPENWDQRIDPASGKVYFHYHKTRGSTYVDPRGCPRDWDMRLSKDNDVYFAYMPAMKTTWTDPRGLEENWEACLDDKGRIYFKDIENKTTTWNDPRQEQNEVVRTKWRQEQMTRWLKEQVMQELEKMRKDEDEDEVVVDAEHV